MQSLIESKGIYSIGKTMISCTRIFVKTPRILDFNYEFTSKPDILQRNYIFLTVKLPLTKGVLVIAVKLSR